MSLLRRRALLAASQASNSGGGGGYSFVLTANMNFEGYGFNYKEYYIMEYGDFSELLEKLKAVVTDENKTPLDSSYNIVINGIKFTSVHVYKWDTTIRADIYTDTGQHLLVSDSLIKGYIAIPYEEGAEILPISIYSEFVSRDGNEVTYFVQVDADSRLDIPVYMDISFYDENGMGWAIWTTPELSNENPSGSDFITFYSDAPNPTNLSVGVGYIYLDYGAPPRILPNKFRADRSGSGYCIYGLGDIWLCHEEYIADFLANNDGLFEPIPDLQMGPVDTSQKSWYWGLIEGNYDNLYFADDPDFNMASEIWKFNGWELTPYY